MKGHCHCSAVSWQSDAQPAWTAYCHCADCRRNCAAPVTAFFGMPHEDVHWYGTAPQIYHSSEGVERLFCGECGTPMAYRHVLDKKNIHLYITTLENPETLPPARHVFHAEHLPWLNIDDDLPRHEKMPR